MEKFKNALKGKFKNLILNKVRRKIIIAVCIFLIILAPAFIFRIKMKDGKYKEKDKSNVPYNASTYTASVTIDENGLHTGKTAQEIWDENKKNKGQIDKYLKNADELERMMNAEIITQYPKIGVESGLDGIIEIERNTSGTNKKLKYMKLDEFNSNVKNNNVSLVDYFTLDEEQNLVIAYVSTTTIEKDGNKQVEQSVATKPINYKDVVKKYSMPFQYLWSFLVIGEDKDFIFELVDLVEKSEITITINDNIDTTTEVNEVITTKTKTTNNPLNEEGVTTETTTTDEKTTTITEVDNPEAAITKANIWFMDYSRPYNYSGEKEKSNDANSTTDHSTSSERIPIKKDGKDAEIYTEIKTEITYKNEVRTVGQEYIAGKVNKKPKDEKREDEVNFVTILCQNKYHDLKKLYLRSGTDWLFDLLENNPDTVNMVDLTNYLLYKVSGGTFDYLGNAKDFSFDEFDPGDMNSFGLGSGGASYESLHLTSSDMQILYKITSAERGGGTQQQQEYVVSVILNRVLSSKFPSTVHGVVFAKDQFQPTRNGAYEAAVPSATTKAAVDNVVKNGDTTGFAVYFMTPAASLGQQSWLKNCIFLFNDSGDNSRQNTNTSGTHNFYTTQDVINELQQYAKAGGGTIVDNATKLHKYLRENGYSYRQASVNLPNTATRTIDCSSFVTWVLLNSNVKGFTSGMGQWTSSTFAKNPQGWQEVSVGSAQPGDILVYNSHVEIVAATGSDKFIVYNCGGNSSIKSTSCNGIPEASVSGHSKSSIKKILRVP